MSATPTDPATGRPVAEPPRAAVFALGSRVPPKVTTYAGDLADLGWRVDLVVIDQRRRDEIAQLDHRIRLHHLLPAEDDALVRRVERFLVFRLPGGVLARARALVGRSRWTRPLDLPLAGLTRCHRWVANPLHKRLFLPLYRHAKPWVLGRVGPARLSWARTERLDGIVAADVDSVSLGYRLARQHPEALATTALDVKAVAARTPPRTP